MSDKYYTREELKGKPVVNQEAIIVGEVEDLALTVDGKVGISVKSGEGDEFLLRPNDIKKIGDVILLKSEDDEKKSESTSSEKQRGLEEISVDSPQKNICSSCGWENEPGTKFCVKCGSKLS